MTVHDKLNLIKRNTAEIIGLEELEKMLENGEKLKHYIGFEISGRIHLGTGIMSMMKVKDLHDAGIECSIFLADWHAWINDKLGGDKEIIKEVGIGYFKEGMIECYKLIGGNPEDIKFILGSELYHNNDEYWQTFIDVCKNLTLARVTKSTTIMGRNQGETMPFAWLVYPPMQVADIFVQGLNLAHAGIDQRKAHVIAREVATKLKYAPLKNKAGEIIKPIALHHNLILGLNKPDIWPIIDKESLQEVLSQMKMSKSKPDSAVFIDDNKEDIKRKISKAFCPDGEIEFNPILDWTKNIIFPNSQKGIAINREEKYGGNINYANYENLERDFKDKKMSAVDLKNFVANWLIDFLRPAREHFSKGKAKEMKEYLEKVQKFKK
ncbi:MAG TPA: tyrosine--tRNA ligase [bacterium]|nr:tyrosine--tRNA ligase [bacterium]